MIIGICGKSGSGKSTIAKEMAKRLSKGKIKAVHCDVDKIGHHVMTLKEVQEEAIKCFGEAILTDGQIDRKKLSELVFTSRDKMKQLTDITWDHMQHILDEIVRDSDSSIIVLDWILLSQTPYFDRCDLKILIDVPYEIRKARAMQRDGITAAKFDVREQASIDYNIEKFDLVFDNSDKFFTRKLVSDNE